MIERELIILIVQIIAALGVVVSVVYLGMQIKQQNIITKAQFGHSLTLRDFTNVIFKPQKMQNTLNLCQQIGMKISGIL